MDTRQPPQISALHPPQGRCHDTRHWSNWGKGPSSMAEGWQKTTHKNHQQVPCWTRPRRSTQQPENCRCCRKNKSQKEWKLLNSRCRRCQKEWPCQHPMALPTRSLRAPQRTCSMHELDRSRPQASGTPQSRWSRRCPRQSPHKHPS